MPLSTYLLVVAVVVACLSVWFGLNLQPFTLYNTLRLQQLFATTKTAQITAPPVPISFYKLSIQWPPSTCSSGITCKPPTPAQFTIHGIWPQDVNDQPVPAYDPTNPCTTSGPTPASSLPTELNPILQDLKSLWPDLKDPQNLSANFKFWGYEWTKHGTCSDYPTQPRKYFDSAVQLRKGLNPVMGLTVGRSYTVQAVVNIVHSNVGATPEIACNRNKVTKARQLWEIRLCYDKPMAPQLPHTLRNCPKSFSGQCTSPNDTINFPN